MVTFYTGDQICFKLNARNLQKSIIDLTTATVVLRYKIGTAAAVEISATVTDGLAGQAEAWVTIGSAVGDIWWEWTITTAGKPATGPQIRRNGTVVARLV